MKVVLDARWIFPEISGIGAYTRELIRHLAQADENTEYVLLFDNAEVQERTLRETGTADAGNLRGKLLDYGVFSLRNQVLLPGVLRREQADIFHSPNYMVPFAAFPRHRRGRTACVTTVHDVIPLMFRRDVGRSKKARMFHLYRRVMMEAAARSDAIITDSRASARDAVQHLRIAPAHRDRVVTIYCGVSTRFTPPDGGAYASRDALPDGVRALLAQPDPGRFLLYVGRSDPYKNVCLLIRALHRLRTRMGLPLSLVLAGSPDPRYPEAAQLTAELGLGDAVHWTGYVSDEALVALYRHAELLVHASRYEGFGLQVVEAMACGLPVVCSDGGSLPEVAGDAALVCRTDDLDGFVDATQQGLSDPSLRGRLRERGFKQAASFSWTRTAEATLRLYRTLHNGGPA